MQKNNICTGSRVGKLKAQEVWSSPRTPICTETRSHNHSCFVRAWNFLGYVLPRHVVQQPPEEHLHLTLLFPVWMSEVNRQRYERVGGGGHWHWKRNARHNKAFSLFWSMFH